MSAEPIAVLAPAVGTRGSALALTQTGWVIDRIALATGRRLRRTTVSTLGDRSAQPLTSMPSTGVFVAELRHALLAGDVDVAVHSMKDLPSAGCPGLVIAAVPAREPAVDVLVTATGARSLEELPRGAVVGTGAPRRRAQLLARRPDLRVVAIRGNVDTRLRRAAPGSGDLDAVVLAAAGLARIGARPPGAVDLDPDVVVPAPGQGALAVEVRAGDGELAELIAAVDDPTARATTTAERRVLAALEAGCTAAVGVHARLDGPQLVLTGVVLDPDGRHAVRATARGPAFAPEPLGDRVAARLLADGAGPLLAAAHAEEVVS